jgi:hypothetical protein
MDGYYESTHLIPDSGPPIDLMTVDQWASSDIIRRQMPSSFNIRVEVAPLGAKVVALPTPKHISRRAYKRAGRSAEISRCGTTIQEGNQIPTSPFISVT